MVGLRMCVGVYISTRANSVPFNHEMGKGLKLQLSFLNSIQICRPRDPSSLVKSPLPALTYISPLISKTYHDISIPSFADPPPSPPHHFSTKCNVGSKSCITHDIKSGLNDELSSQAYSRTRKNEQERLYDFPFSSGSNERARPIAPSRIEKKKEITTTKKPKAKLVSVDSLSSPPSLNTSHGFNNPLRTTTKQSATQTSVRTRRFRRFGSKERKDASEEETGREKRPVSRGLDVPCMVDRKVKQSFVVVKRSVDPYEDFKKSMLEMILEKHMFEPKELEQLLMSFLSLNSRMHHEAILKAFTEIWKVVFSGTST